MSEKKLGKVKDILEAVAQWTRSIFVAKEPGKGLSTNDFTDTYKNDVDNSVKDEEYVLLSCSLNVNDK